MDDHYTAFPDGAAPALAASVLVGSPRGQPPGDDEAGRQLRGLRNTGCRSTSSRSSSSIATRSTGSWRAKLPRCGVGSRTRVLAVFDWTARRIQPTPEGWPVVDDHILNIIIRGYGMTDQRADVFATLTTYAGVPAFWQR